MYATEIFFTILAGAVEKMQGLDESQFSAPLSHFIYLGHCLSCWLKLSLVGEEKCVARNNLARKFFEFILDR